MQKTVIRYAIHKKGTESFGYLCLNRKDAEDALSSIQSHMEKVEATNYEICRLSVAWEEDNNDS